ncbi:MAG: hypothetical protein IT244_02930 [Bacteroidia bacterium]|nr:hypothetical protein [Bacteroidia bacterium]
MKRILGICLFSASSMLLGQQIPMGTWRIHPSFTDTRLMECAEKNIYGASEFGFFRVNLGNANIEKLGGMEGFHGTSISCLSYSPSKKTMVIGYADGFIDLLNNEKEITPITGFFNKLLQGDKQIKHASFNGDFVFLSTDFGILVVDLIKGEIKDSYTSIGTNGGNQIVLSTAIVGDSIYAGLPDGIIAAKYSPSVNLNNYTNWKRIFNSKPAFQLTAFADSLWFYSDSVLTFYKKGIFKQVATQGVKTIAKIQCYNNKLYVFRPGGITSITIDGTSNSTFVNILAHGTVDPKDATWYCTGIGGGLQKITPQGEIPFEPNGPSSNSVFGMTKTGETVYATAGGVNSTFGNAYNPDGFYFFSNYKWTSNPSSPFLTGLYDYTYAVTNTITNNTFLATHTNGLLQLKNNVPVFKHDENNSPLQRDIGSGFIRVSGAALDADGNLWVNNFGANTPLLRLDKAGNWQAIPIDEVSVKNLVIDENGYKWMILQTGGVFVFDDNKTPTNVLDDRSIRLTTSNGLIANEVLSLAADRNGYVWIGTAQGLNVVTNTFEVFKKPKVDRFIITVNGEDGYLLGEESINDICVDGGNRKWFATNNGVFLIDPNGQQVIYNFDNKNSPLPNNIVYCIGQNSVSGELFFGTESGIASYRNDASEANASFSEIKIYPNPVKPDYDGLITIEGLAQDAEIRITDAAGILIYQTKANGGTATWPGTRLNGTKPNSGVLYVFGVNADGTETAMGKFVYIR